ncbi:MAG: glycosyltransferase [Chthoniobacteraceae bacterium]|nr:glycosyltransferase [Chthoniobacteraceae bacterium]
MKVLHLSASDGSDSASRAALHLHRALQARGVESRFAVANRPAEGLFAIVQAGAFDANARTPLSSAFQVGEGGEMPDLSGADVIHLHQVAGALPPRAVREALAAGRPVVWSLADAWPFTGGCFHPGDCAGYRENCAGCPQLSASADGLLAALLEEKRAAYAPLAGAENLTLLAPNAWLAEAARKSPLFREARVEIFPPAFPTGARTIAADAPLRCAIVLESGAPAHARQTLQALFAATDTYGAFRRLVRTGRVKLTVHGADPFEIPGLPVCFAGAGAPALAETDLLVLPRPDEARSAAVAEALAQGVPVLAFETPGIGDFVTHRVNGWLVRRLEVEPFAEALCHLAAHPAQVAALAGQPCPCPSPEAAAERLEALYASLLASVSPVPAAPSPAPEALEAASAAVRAQGEALLCEIARRILDLPRLEAVQARGEAVEHRLRGMEILLETAQRDLAKLEKRQQAAEQSAPAPLRKELGKIRKAAASLRNHLKWRSRRLKIFPAPDTAAPGTPRAVAAPPPRVAPWARLVHRLFLKRHWMKHGKKDQYPPRPVRPETFPRPKLADDRLPTLAIVTPSFQQAAYLEETLRSVLDQHYPKLAYAVQDGGSTDGSRPILERYAPRLTVWSSGPDSGQSRAVADGFEKVTGDIMAWVNSDDAFVPGAFRFVAEYFAAHPEVDVIYGNRIILNERSEEVARWVLPPHNPRLVPYLDPVPQETLFWRASIWEKVGGIDPSFRFALDWDLVARFQKAGAKIVHVPYFLGFFRVHSQQKLSVKAENIGAEETARLRLRETGRAVSFDDLAPYKRWMETYGAIYSRLLELGIRLG